MYRRLGSAHREITAEAGCGRVRRPSGGVELELPRVVLEGGTRRRPQWHAAQQRVALRHVSATEHVREQLRLHEVVSVAVDRHLRDSPTSTLTKLLEVEVPGARVLALERGQRQVVDVIEPVTRVLEDVPVRERRHRHALGRVLAEVHRGRRRAVVAAVAATVEKRLEEVVICGVPARAKVSGEVSVGEEIDGEVGLEVGVSGSLRVHVFRVVQDLVLYVDELALQRVGVVVEHVTLRRRRCMIDRRRRQLAVLYEDLEHVVHYLAILGGVVQRVRQRHHLRYQLILASSK